LLVDEEAPQRGAEGVEALAQILGLLLQFLEGPVLAAVSLDGLGAHGSSRFLRSCAREPNGERLRRRWRFGAA
jgi:hypothetical protein